MKHITDAHTEHTGGDCMADLLTLASGQVVVLADECVAVYPNIQQWREGPHEDVPMLETSLPRAESVTRFGFLTFAHAFAAYEPDGPVSVDLVALADGRVVGIDSDTLFIYPDMETFHALTSGAISEDPYQMPSIRF